MIGKAALVDLISEGSQVTKVDTEKVLESFMDIIFDKVLQEGSEVRLLNFGKLSY